MASKGAPPAKKRKDGAPTVLVEYYKSEALGRTPFLGTFVMTFHARNGLALLDMRGLQGHNSFGFGCGLSALGLPRCQLATDAGRCFGWGDGWDLNPQTSGETQDFQSLAHASEQATTVAQNSEGLVTRQEPHK
jgi:hypothetical protein